VHRINSSQLYKKRNVTASAAAL